jgi:hypothetical protein
MKRTFTVCSILAVLLGASLAIAELNEKRGNGPGGVPQSTYFVHRLGTDHAEGITVIDMNNDGKPDLVSGAYWYENPGPQGGEWKQHQYRKVEIVGEFVSDCGEWAIDVNHDGAPDLVTVGWQTDGLFWFENPKQQGVEWKKHFITHTLETEGGWLSDINGDGKPDLVLAHYGRSGIFWVDFAGSEPKVHHAGGHDEDGHGTGVADIDGDGKMDILTPHGWFKNIDADNDKLEWHGDWDLGETGFPIIGYDVNNDGKTDLIYGRGHSYGLYWMEQEGNAGNRHWEKHIIDESFSQVHALKLVDLDGDGEPELLAGKRYRGHNGNDPGSYDPLVVYYYKIDRKAGTFTRYPVSVGGTQGAGTQFITEDLDGDGDIDIATAGKSGVHLAENLQIDHVSKDVREKQILINTQWPFPGEGTEVEWQRAPKK